VLCDLDALDPRWMAAIMFGMVDVVVFLADRIKPRINKKAITTLPELADY
jgi:hypothetical protein